jgi:hypothetical protein
LKESRTRDVTTAVEPKRAAVFVDYHPFLSIVSLFLLISTHFCRLYSCQAILFARFCGVSVRFCRLRVRWQRFSLVSGDFTDF